MKTSSFHSCSHHCCFSSIPAFITAGLASLALICGLSSCTFDDTALQNSIDDLTSRVEALEDFQKQVQGDIASLQDIISKLNSSVTVNNVVDNGDGSWTINFSDGTSVTIRNGQDGEDGLTPPSITIVEEDGTYYWAYENADGTTEFILDGDGNKIPVSGEAPQVRINEDGYWEISSDGGKTWENTGVKAEGGAGDSFFSGVYVEGGILYLVLADGTVIEVPMTAELAFDFGTGKDTLYFKAGETKELAYTMSGQESVTVNKPDGWRISFQGSSLSVTAPVEENIYAETEGVVSVILISAGGQSLLAEQKVAIGDDSGEIMPGTNQFVYDGEIFDIATPFYSPQKEMLDGVGTFYLPSKNGFDNRVQFLLPLDIVDNASEGIIVNLNDIQKWETGLFIDGVRTRFDPSPEFTSGTIDFTLNKETRTMKVTADISYNDGTHLRIDYDGPITGVYGQTQSIGSIDELVGTWKVSEIITMTSTAEHYMDNSHIITISKVNDNTIEIGNFTNGSTIFGSQIGNGGDKVRATVNSAMRMSIGTGTILSPAWSSDGSLTYLVPMTNYNIQGKQATAWKEQQFVKTTDGTMMLVMQNGISQLSDLGNPMLTYAVGDWSGGSLVNTYFYACCTIWTKISDETVEKPSFEDYLGTYTITADMESNMTPSLGGYEGVRSFTKELEENTISVTLDEDNRIIIPATHEMDVEDDKIYLLSYYYPSGITWSEDRLSNIMLTKK